MSGDGALDDAAVRGDRARDDTAVADAGRGPAIAVLTLSPALDCTVTLPHLDLGRSHRVAPAAEVLGGKGINVARVLAALGVEVVALGPVARDHWPLGDDAPANEPGPVEETTADATANERRLRWELTDTPAPLRRSLAIVEADGRATLVNETAHPHSAEVWTRLQDTVERRLTEPALRVLVISGATPEDCPADLVPNLVAAAHAAGVGVVVDTSANGLLAAARAGADWVKPNDEELRELFSLPDEDADLPAAARRLIAAGAGHVLLSQGAEGMTLVDGTGPRRRARLEHPVQGNPTGAGDAAVAALAWTLADGGTGAEPRTTAPTHADHPGPDDRAEVGDHLGEDEIDALLTRAVAVSAAAVLMPQAGQIHPSWGELRSQVLLTDAPTESGHATSRTTETTDQRSGARE